MTQKMARIKAENDLVSDEDFLIGFDLDNVCVCYSNDEEKSGQCDKYVSQLPGLL